MGELTAFREFWRQVMQRGVVEYPEVIGIRLSRLQAQQLRQLARADDRPTSAWLRRLIAETLERHAPKNWEVPTS